MRQKITKPQSLQSHDESPKAIHPTNKTDPIQPNLTPIKTDQSTPHRILKKTSFSPSINSTIQPQIIPSSHQNYSSTPSHITIQTSFGDLFRTKKAIAKRKAKKALKQEQEAMKQEKVARTKAKAPIKAAYSTAFEARLGWYLSRHPLAEAASKAAIDNINALDSDYSNSSDNITKSSKGKEPDIRISNLNQNMNSFHNYANSVEADGTANKMFQAFKNIGTPTPISHFRLALLGWTHHNKSLTYKEIMEASALHGLNYTPGLIGYRDIEPLSVPELRENVCSEYIKDPTQQAPPDSRLFPYEKMYLYNRDLPDKNTNKSGFKNTDLWPKTQKGTNSAKELAIKIFSSQSFVYQNQIMSPDLSEEEKKARIEHEIQHNRRAIHYGNNLSKTSIDRIYREAKKHNKVLKESLKELPNWEGTVYRGDSKEDNTGIYDPNKQIRFDRFVSTSIDPEIPKAFMGDGNGVPLFLEMNVKYGRDIQKLSAIEGEAEILLPPGAEFVVTDRQRKPKSSFGMQGDDFYDHITMEQTSGGEYENSATPTDIESSSENQLIEESS